MRNYDEDDKPIKVRPLQSRPDPRGQKTTPMVGNPQGQKTTPRVSDRKPKASGSPEQRMPKKPGKRTTGFRPSKTLGAAARKTARKTARRAAATGTASQVYRRERARKGARKSER